MPPSLRDRPICVVHAYENHTGMMRQWAACVPVCLPRFGRGGQRIASTKRHDTGQAAKPLVTASAALHWPIVLCSLPIFILSFLLPIHAKKLGASATSIGGLYSLIALIMVVMRPSAGWAMDRLGRKGFLVAVLLCYACAMGLFALAWEVTTLYLARLVQGFGRALTWVAAYTMVTEGTASQERGEALGRGVRHQWLCGTHQPLPVAFLARQVHHQSL